MEPARYPNGRGMVPGYNRCPTPSMPCKDRSHDSIDAFPVGMSYVPWQSWGELYSPEKGLCEGTIFVDLNQIFCGKRGNRG